MTSTHLKLSGYEPVYPSSSFHRQIDASTTEVVEVARRDLPDVYELVRVAAGAAQRKQDTTSQMPAYRSLVQVIQSRPDEIQHWANPSAAFRPYAVVAYSRGDFGPPMSTSQVIGTQPSLEIAVSTLPSEFFKEIRKSTQTPDDLTQAVASADRTDRAIADVQMYAGELGHEVLRVRRDASDAPVMSLSHETHVRRTGLAVAQAVDRQGFYEQLNDRSMAYAASEAEKLVTHVHSMLDRSDGLAKAVQAAFRGQIV